MNPVDLYARTAIALAESFETEMNQFKSRMEAQLRSAKETNQELQEQIEKLRLEIHKQQIENLEKADQIGNLQSLIQSCTAQNKNLQDYLDLFLNHPAYKAYKFTRRVWEKLMPGTYDSFPQDIQYEIFQRTLESREKVNGTQLHTRPLLNLVTAVFDPPFEIFSQTVQSVLDQTYKNWVWDVADASTSNIIWTYLTELSKKDARIRPLKLLRNEGIAGNTNAGLKRATGDYIVMLDHDDELPSNALREVAYAIQKNPGVDFLYSDADKLDWRSRRCRPLFKPNWSPESMFSYNLLNQLTVFRRNLLDQVGFLDPQMDGAQDWDFYLRISEKTDEIHHIPKVLYHWRELPGSTALSIRNKPYAQQAQIAAIKNHLERTGIADAQVYFVPGHSVHETHPLVKWKPLRKWTVSIIIPSRDHVQMVSTLLDSLLHRTSYEHFQIILVDTGSVEDETWAAYNRYKNDHRFSLVRFDAAFNFGKACNLGASHSDGDLLLFLNNDTEVVHPDWLELMVQWMDRKGVAIVGPKLLYPNGKIQHAGVIVGFGGLAGHLFINEPENTNSIAGSESWYRNVSAVTGACLLIRKDTFHKVGGFDEGFQLHYSDVDLCLKVRKAGYRILYTPQVRLIHHESVTHKGIVPRADFERAAERWQDILQKGDPYFNPNLTYSKAHPDFRQGEADTPCRLHTRLMKRLPQKEFIRLPDDVIL
jgi:GT2 family glycosyltransferase